MDQTTDLAGYWAMEKKQAAGDHEVTIRLSPIESQPPPSLSSFSSSAATSSISLEKKQQLGEIIEADHHAITTNTNNAASATVTASDRKSGNRRVRAQSHLLVAVRLTIATIVLLIIMNTISPLMPVMSIMLLPLIFRHGRRDDYTTKENLPPIGIFRELHIRNEVWKLSLLLILLYQIVIVILVLSITISTAVIDDIHHWNLEFLGIPYWKWVILVDIVALGRQIIAVILAAVYYTINFILKATWLTRLQTISDSASISYYINGLIDPFMSMFYFGAILSIWLIYFPFSLHHHLKIFGKNPTDSITWGIVSLFIGSILWIFKDAALLYLLAENVYLRKKDKLLKRGYQLYFLSLICGCKFRVLHQTRKEGEMRSKKGKDDDDDDDAAKWSTVMDNFTNTFKSIIKGDRPGATLDDLEEIASCFKSIAVADNSSTEKNQNIKDLESRCSRMIGDRKFIDEDGLKNIFNFDEKDANLFMQELRWENNQSHEISYDMLLTWLMDVHKNSLRIGNTLLVADSIRNYLNTLMDAVIAGSMIVAWLLLTKSSFKVMLFTVGGTFASLTFIFKDTCKQSFEGIVFAFITHPFLVGGKYVIDKEELMVKDMNALRTKFVKVRTKEEISVSNAELSNKAITDLTEDSDIHDTVELSLDSSTVDKSSIQTLEQMIKIFFVNDEKRRYDSFIKVTIDDIKNTVNMTISYKHRLTRNPGVNVKIDPDEKHIARSDFLIALNQMLKDSLIKRSPLTTT